MAYSKFRFNENAAGMTGKGNVAVYDGAGTGAQGGDPVDKTGGVGAGNINTDGFFPADSALADAVRAASRGRSKVGPRNNALDATTGGAGLLCFLWGNNGLMVDVLYVDEETGAPGTPTPTGTTPTVKCRGSQAGTFNEGYRII